MQSLDLDVLAQRERRPIGRQLTNDMGQQRLRHALERADTQAFYTVSLELLDVGARRVQPCVDGARVLEETLSFECQRDLA